jgi:hypothetical protein
VLHVRAADKRKTTYEELVMCYTEVSKMHYDRDYNIASLSKRLHRTHEQSLERQKMSIWSFVHSGFAASQDVFRIFVGYNYVFAACLAVVHLINSCRLLLLNNAAVWYWNDEMKICFPP